MPAGGYAPLIYKKDGGNTLVVASGATLQVDSGGSITGTQMRQRQLSIWFNLDNGAATTVDDVLMKPTSAITILAARIIYVDATTGTVAAGNVKIGTTLGGAEIVAATAYENTKAGGTETALVIVSGAVAAGTAVFVRHTGVAATQAGQAIVEIEYTVNA